MISPGVEISITGCEVTMVRGPISGLFFSFFIPFFFCNHALFVLDTKSLMQREL